MSKPKYELYIHNELIEALHSENIAKAVHENHSARGEIILKPMTQETIKPYHNVSLSVRKIDMEITENFNGDVQTVVKVYLTS